MADVDICSRQRVVIGLRTAGGCSPIEIHRCLRSMCGVETIDVSSFRCWFCHPKSVEKDIGGRPRSGQPATALTTETKDKVNVPIWHDCHIMTNELCSAVGI
jgi:hypothetical protein